MHGSISLRHVHKQLTKMMTVDVTIEGRQHYGTILAKRSLPSTVLQDQYIVISLSFWLATIIHNVCCFNIKDTKMWALYAHSVA